MEKMNIKFSKYIADDRQHIASLLFKAVNNLIADDNDLMESIRNISEYLEEQEDCFPVVTVSRDDIRNIGYNPAHLTNEQMRNIAIEAYTDDLGDSFWYALRYTSEEMDLPELRTEIDDLYNEYLDRNSKEPLYADIWLEDAGGNNLPWQDRIKLSLDVEESEDNDIYMYFNGYLELKEWLFATLDDNNKDRDRWCYDEPQHRIVFFDTLK